MNGSWRVALAIAVVLVGPSLARAQTHGVLKVTSFPSGATVVVDGVPTGKLTPTSLSATLGDHRVEVSIPGGGWIADVRTVTIASGNNDLSVTLIPESAGPPTATPHYVFLDSSPVPKSIGVPVALNQTMLQTSLGVPFTVYLDGRGFQETSPRIGMFFTTVDCTGVGYYAQASAREMYRWGRTTGGIAHFPSDDIAGTVGSLNILSQYTLGCDRSLPPADTVLVWPTQVNLHSLGFVPPFRLELRP